MSPRDGRPGPYRRADHEPVEGHPVDVAVDRRLPLKRLRRRIRAAERRLADALGGRRNLWLGLEELLNEYRARREEAYFDLGWEQGAADGHAEAFRTLAGGPAPDPDARGARAFADRIRELAVQADLPAPLTVAALLETAWAFALGLADNPATRSQRRH